MRRDEKAAEEPVRTAEEAVAEEVEEDCPLSAPLGEGGLERFRLLAAAVATLPPCDHACAHGMLLCICWRLCGGCGGCE